MSILTLTLSPKTVGAVALVMSLAGPLPAAAVDNRASGVVPPAPMTSQSYDWHDGDERHTVWLDAQLLAEFAGGAQAGSRVANRVAGAVPAGRHGAVSLWRIDTAAGDGAAASRQLRSVDPGARVSPVFRDTPGGGRQRALPGNVIVSFQPAWSATRIAEWVAGRNLQIVAKLPVGTNIYLIATGPGLEALETANRIHESGDVVSAMPNWWTEKQPR